MILPLKSISLYVSLKNAAKEVLKQTFMGRKDFVQKVALMLILLAVARKKEERKKLEHRRFINYFDFVFKIASVK